MFIIAKLTESWLPKHYLRMNQAEINVWSPSNQVCITDHTRCGSSIATLTEVILQSVSEDLSENYEMCVDMAMSVVLS